MTCSHGAVASTTVVATRPVPRSPTHDTESIPIHPFHVVVHEPEIPPNTGNLMRLCVNTGAELHLVRPLGFEMDDARLRRAGLDYKHRAGVTIHDSFDDFLSFAAPPQVWAFTQRGDIRYDLAPIAPGAALVFGKESVGLPNAVLAHPAISGLVRIPIAPGGRSLNLANAAAIALYDVWRRQSFAGSADPT